MRLIPQPESIEIFSGTSTLKDITKKELDLSLNLDGEYELIIEAGDITARASCDRGFYYAELSLKQIVREGFSERVRGLGGGRLDCLGGGRLLDNGFLCRRLLGRGLLCGCFGRRLGGCGLLCGGLFCLCLGGGGNNRFFLYGLCRGGAEGALNTCFSY